MLFFFSAAQFPLTSLCAVQMEWLISEGPISPKWHARLTPQLCFTTGDSDNPCRQWRGFTKKQKIDKPIIVLTDLPHCYQSLQVLIGLVRVDVVQWAAVPGVPIGGCKINGNLARKMYKMSNMTESVKFFLSLLIFFTKSITWLLIILQVILCEQGWNMPNGSINYLIRGKNLYFFTPTCTEAATVFIHYRSKQPAISTGRNCI